MYCSTCGTFLASSLKYCNRCGTQLAIAEGGERQGPPLKLIDVLRYLATASAAVVGGGLFFVVILIKLLLKHNSGTAAMAFLAALSLVVVFGIGSMLIYQLSRVLTIYLQQGGGDEMARPALKGRVTGELEPLRMPVASVTEHTTKILPPDNPQPHERL